MNLPMDLMLEAIVCVLLVATIGYCATLDRRLRAMRTGQDGLRDLIRDLSGATGQAMDAIARLRQASDATGGALAEQVKRGRALADELSLMVQAGNDIANRLGGIETRRPAAPQPAAGPRIVQSKPAAKAAEPHPLLDLLKRAR
ncbi:MAG: DUF6468 domain-containing protein [Parvibaculum sp.]|uniref:DUF6468 domain-containing protein n=1 Tax=Parvibaculum sp. TaxID=2024848 RepID=UPI0025D10ED5|nr:DUF6468 domain-containing protein [Parvibaculum sp.]MCE9650687.1 DUF6468 domain-containing protein [Parvibaculum sp.]